MHCIQNSILYLLFQCSIFVCVCDNISNKKCVRIETEYGNPLCVHSFVKTIWFHHAAAKTCRTSFTHRAGIPVTFDLVGVRFSQNINKLIHMVSDEIQPQPMTYKRFAHRTWWISLSCSHLNGNQIEMSVFAHTKCVLAIHLCMAAVARLRFLLSFCFARFSHCIRNFLKHLMTMLLRNITFAEWPVCTLYFPFHLFQTHISSFSLSAAYF